tara:strand:+ start:1063 stop:1290 length:228 start_codon:yes stop_codon:yes gene_type:complete
LAGGVPKLKDRSIDIQNIIKKMVKSKSFPYSNAVNKIKKDRKGYFQAKDIKQKSKSLSTDRFQQYLKDIQENDTD